MTRLLLVLACCVVFSYTVVAKQASESDAFTDAESVVDPSRGRRLKRLALSLPDNTSCKITLDMSIPVVPLNNTFTSLTLDLPFRFVLPTYTQLNSLYSTLGRMATDDGQLDDRDVVDHEFLEEQRSNEQRSFLYKHIESIFESFGYDGAACTQRAICELAEAPLGHHGLLGKIVHLFFSPSVVKVPEKMKKFLSSTTHRIRRESSLENEVNLLERPTHDQYTEAFTTGKERKCWARYYTCPISLFTFLNI